jgi:hypothetical protein
VIRVTVAVDTRPIKRFFMPFWREAAIRWYRWALREIDPMHPDVPFIVNRLHHWENASG